MTRLVSALLAAAGLLVASPALAADGAKTFLLQCKSCHAAKSGPMGPSLTGVAGRKIASLADYKYSTGLVAKSAMTWTDANLEAFLAAPIKFAPGTKMMTGLAAPADRAAVIAYMKGLR